MLRMLSSRPKTVNRCIVFPPHILRYFTLYVVFLDYILLQFYAITAPIARVPPMPPAARSAHFQEETAPYLDMVHLTPDLR